MLDNPTPSSGSPVSSAPPLASPEPTPPSGKFEDVKWLFIGGSLVGTLLICLISVYQWFAPFVPILLALAMGAGLSAMITYLSVTERRREVFLRGAGIWALLALPTALWAVAPVRALSAELFGEALSAPAQSSLLQDSGDSVRVRGCIALGSANRGALAYDVMAHLFDAPALALECVETAGKSDADAASRLANAYMKQWRGALREQDGEAVCRATPRLFEFSLLTNTSPALELTRCAVGDPDDAIGACCADALSGHFFIPADYTAQLGSVEGLTLAQRTRLFRELIPFAFARTNASRRALPDLESKLLRTREGQDWVVALGCDTLLRGPTPDLIDGMEAVAASQDCRVGGEEMLQAASWPQICLSWAVQPERSANLCDALERDAQLDAVQTAIALVHDATRVMEVVETSEQIERAAQQLRRPKDTSAALGEMTHEVFNAAKLPHDVFGVEERRFFDTYMRSTELTTRHYRAYLADLRKEKAEEED